MFGTGGKSKLLERYLSISDAKESEMRTSDGCGVFYLLSLPSASGIQVNCLTRSACPFHLILIPSIVNTQVEPVDLQVELIDEEGPVAMFQDQPLAGFKRERGKLVRQDGLQYRILWQSHETQRTFADAVPHQPFITRFV